MRANVRPLSWIVWPSPEGHVRSGVKIPSLTQKWVPVPLCLKMGSPWTENVSAAGEDGKGENGGKDGAGAIGGAGGTDGFGECGGKDGLGEKGGKDGPGE